MLNCPHRSQDGFENVEFASYLPTIVGLSIIDHGLVEITVESGQNSDVEEPENNSLELEQVITACYKISLIARKVQQR